MWVFLANITSTQVLFHVHVAMPAPPLASIQHLLEIVRNSSESISVLSSHCKALQHTAMHCITLLCTATHFDTLQRNANHSSALSSAPISVFPQNKHIYPTSIAKIFRFSERHNLGLIRSSLHNMILKSVCVCDVSVCAQFRVCVEAHNVPRGRQLDVLLPATPHPRPPAPVHPLPSPSLCPHFLHLSDSLVRTQHVPSSLPQFERSDTRLPPVSQKMTTPPAPPYLHLDQDPQGETTCASSSGVDQVSRSRGAAECCTVLQSVAVYCSVLPRSTVRCQESRLREGAGACAILCGAAMPFASLALVAVRTLLAAHSCSRRGVPLCHTSFSRSPSFCFPDSSSPP